MLPKIGTMNEKQAFSARLLQAMHQAQIQVRSPTRLTLEFNLRYPGKPVTTQAVRKWLLGGAIPSQDKIFTLAKWLGVSTEWLRFGENTYAKYAKGETGKRIYTDQDRQAYLVSDAELCSDINKLSDAHKKIIREMVSTLLRLEKKEK